MKLPTRSLAFLVGGLMVGTALAPVGAQQIAPPDGQLAVRSDGAVYLIYNAQRYWVPTVQITDEELNAYPEGAPIYTGLAPIGSPATAGTTSTTGAPTAGTTSAPTTGTTSGTGPASAVSPDLPLEVDIDGEATFEPDERIIVNVKSKTGASCDLTVRWPDGTETPQAPMTVDSSGRCRYSIEIAANAAPGIGLLKGVVRDGGKTSSQEIEYEIIPKN